jgi:hypothetical protein
VVEGAPLLREYGTKSHRGFESLSLRQNVHRNAPVAQLDRVPGYEPGGREFESLRARHLYFSPLLHFSVKFDPPPRPHTVGMMADTCLWLDPKFNIIISIIHNRTVRQSVAKPYPKCTRIIQPT